MTFPARSSTLKVPGAELYYEVRGSGPTLLIIPGGPQDASVFADLARHLAHRYTVVSYDPRGNSRSTFDGEPEGLRLDVQGDDAAALLGVLGDGPAHVFGTSGGAQIGLDLTSRYPELVRTLVARETPAVVLLDDPSEALAADLELHDVYRREGTEAAMAAFFAMNGLGEGAGRGTRPRSSPPRPRPPRRSPGSAATSSTGSRTACCPFPATAPTSRRCGEANPASW